MNVDVLEKISYIAFTSAFILGVFSIVLYFKLNIKAVIDDLSGKKAERQIKAYREKSVNEKSNISLNEKSYQNFIKDAFEEKTVKLQEDNVGELEKTVLLEETVLLTNEEETMPLNKKMLIEDNNYKLIVNKKIIHTGDTI